ncbi:MAG TPA: hypothetical protein VGF75_05830 [Candidatus Saccharimonadales bacterium]|jgi:hypothetical protein
MSEIPSVHFVNPLNPANSGTGQDVLIYENLTPAVNKYRDTFPERSEAVWTSEPGSLDELSKARQLATEYLLRTAEKLVASDGLNRDIWADRYTQATIELFGEPEKAEAERLLVSEYNLLSELKDQEGISQEPLQFLLDIYEPIVSDYVETETQDTQADNKLERQAVSKYGEAIRAKYQPLFDLVDEDGKDEFSPKDLGQLFNKALDWLKGNDDPEWGKWSVKSIDADKLVVIASDREIQIGIKRETASAMDAKRLIAHELLVHALRAKNGYKTGDSELATGLPDSFNVGEGLGKLSEIAITGEFPDAAPDNYIYVALALGVMDGVQRNRRELFQIGYARKLIRAQLKGDDIDLDSIAKSSWRRVDRIYRGGPGDNIGTRQAVFTKDIDYYVGYKQMAAYINRQLNEGKSAEELFTYLSQGNFDPNNQQHLERLANSQK